MRITIIAALICIGCGESIMPSGYGFNLGDYEDSISFIEGAKKSTVLGMTDYTKESTDDRFKRATLTFVSGRLSGVEFEARECTEDMFYGLYRALNEKIGCAPHERADLHVEWDCMSRKSNTDPTNIVLILAKKSCQLSLFITTTTTQDWLPKGADVAL